VNDGENTVFPIQVSLKELFLFQCVVIFIAVCKHKCVWIPVAGDRSGHMPGQSPTPGANALSIGKADHEQKLRGRILPPSRSISSSVIFIVVAIYFYF
jgi:hypothetical protein